MTESKSNRSVSDSELEILKTLWEHGRLKVKDLRELLLQDGRSWAYNTVQTLLTRLESKGFVASEKDGRAFAYLAAVSRNQFLDNHLSDLVDRVCEGSQTPLLLALVKKKNFSRSEIQEFRQLLDQMEEDES